MTYTYTPHGVCSRQMTVEIENGAIKHVDILGGCNGNLKGIASLLQGMRVEDAIERMKGIRCGMRPTSCPDQLGHRFAGSAGTDRLRITLPLRKGVGCTAADALSERFSPFRPQRIG